MKVIFTAGGGGHFSPVLAVIAVLPKEIEYQIIGRKFTYEGSDTLSLEYLTAQKNNLPFVPITTGRLQRSFSKHSIPSLLKIPVGFFQAKKILQTYRPDVIVSFGGYVSVPVVIAASRLKIPVIIHEQTQEVGLANKIASRFAQKICVSWKESEKYFPKGKTVLTGNPVKPELIQQLQSIKTAAAHSSLFITGGSQGSHKINMLVKHTLSQLLSHISIVHQTGDASQFDDFAQLNQLKGSLSVDLQKRYTLEKFIEPKDMASFIANARLIVCRAGINTITELLLLKKPALVIPLKDGQTHEQEKNAALFVSSGLGESLDEDTTAEQFVEKVLHMLTHGEAYNIKKDVPEFSLHLTAAKKIVEILLYVGNKTTNKTS